MVSQTEKIAFFMVQAGIKNEASKNQVVSFFERFPEGHAIVKRSILYLFDADNMVEAIPLDNVATDLVISFDGKKVSRISPEYYIGSAFVASDGLEFEIDISNNNNNNNNNNGNNNG